METPFIPFDARCKLCKKQRGDHHPTYACPTGTKSRIGYLTWSPTQVFELDSKWKRPANYQKFEL